jgi:hypothetical protein
VIPFIDERIPFGPPDTVSIKFSVH